MFFSALDELDPFFQINVSSVWIHFFRSSTIWCWWQPIQPFRVAFIARAKTMREDRFKRLVDAVCDHGGERKRRKHFANGRVILQYFTSVSVFAIYSFGAFTTFFNPEHCRPWHRNRLILDTHEMALKVESFVMARINGGRWVIQ